MACGSLPFSFRFFRFAWSELLILIRITVVVTYAVMIQTIIKLMIPTVTPNANPLEGWVYTETDSESPVYTKINFGSA